MRRICKGLAPLPDTMTQPSWAGICQSRRGGGLPKPEPQKGATTRCSRDQPLRVLLLLLLLLLSLLLQRWYAAGGKQNRTAYKAPAPPQRMGSCSCCFTPAAVCLGRLLVAHSEASELAEDKLSSNRTILLRIVLTWQLLG
jgi:hypothetical protein